MRIPAIEALFPTPWTAAARRVLPSPSPQFTATAMWGPVLAWSALLLLAESIDADHPESAALDLFDRLRLREPFAKAFAALGFDGETGWRVAARIKVVLLTGAGVGREAESTVEPQPAPPAGALQAVEKPGALEKLGALKGHDFSRAKSGAETTPALAAEGSSSGNSPKTASSSSSSTAGHALSSQIPSSQIPSSQIPASVPADAFHDQTAKFIPQPPTAQPAIPPALWSDPDVRWLTGAHQAEGHDYFLRESYEELLWWLLLPKLLRLAADPVPSRATIAQLVGEIQEALSSAEAAGYRVDLLIAPSPTPLEASTIEPAPDLPETPAPAIPEAETLGTLPSETVAPAATTAKDRKLKTDN
jgi:hypothetical protein